jgi:tRNA (mo5U34)-methyltransferase
MTEQEVVDEVANIPYWYHKIDLPQCQTPGWAPFDRDAYQLPEDMTGKIVLDVGSWDGYWTWESLKRGARYVIAIDDFSDTLGVVSVDRQQKWRSWDLCQKALGFTQSSQRLTMSVYDVCRLGVKFDVILLFGVLYHLKHPTWALEKLSNCACPEGSIHIETAILDGVISPYTGFVPHAEACCAEFYPEDQFGKNQSNWNAPTLKCVDAWLRGTGWGKVETWRLTPYPLNLSQCRGFAKAINSPGLDA